MTELGVDFSFRFIINLFFITFLIYGSYFRRAKNNQIATSFILFGVGIFIITYILMGADMSMGFAFGLFAVFTMLRYRTEPISIKEMTYLFLVIAIALLSSVARVSMLELILLNSIVCVTAIFIDSKILQSKYASKIIIYEKIELIKPENYDELLMDIIDRTGLDVKKIEVLDIDFLKDVAKLNITYLPIEEAEDNDKVVELWMNKEGELEIKNDQNKIVKPS